MSSLPTSLMALHQARPKRKAVATRIKAPREVASIDQDVLCWNCCEETTEWRLPIRRKGADYVCMGSFCSPNCAKRYAIDRLGNRGLESCAMVSELVRKAAGPTARCAPAPPFMCLKDFGGPLSREEFHEGRVVVAPPHVLVEWLKVHS